jgi:hypothetical protein
MRPELAGRIASPARRMSFSLARASEQMVESLMAWAIAWIASKSPGEAAAKPGLDHVDTHFLELPCNADFLFLGHRRTGTLLTIAQVVSKITRCCFIFGF